MADKSNKIEQNIPGAFYVDDQCIACDACVVEAPKIFEMNDDEGYAYVKRQPKNDSDIEDANNALAACPVDAIGNDGSEIS
ncbi:ferredoxin [Bacteriovoracaceae bacterium]|nr:ferredoxin [Bacteriovoracaceae bacterium]